MKKFSIATFGTVMLALGVGSSANALTLASSSGIWTGVNTTDSALRFQTVGNENQVLWGTPSFPSTEQSGLGFSGVTNTNFDVDETFVVGTLRHFNTQIRGDDVLGADLLVNLNFSEPAVNASFNFSFKVEEPFNRPPCPFFSITPCSDRITVSNALTPQTFTINEIDYTLQLLGFGNTPNDAPSSEFIAQEDMTNSRFLFGKITAASSGREVPEPTTLTGLALLGIYFIARRQCQKAA